MRVVVAMSGGVDSSVAALKLKEEGFEPIGVTIKTWPKEECGAEGEKLCCSLSSIQFARSVAEDLDIPYYVIDLSKEFAAEVKKYFAEEYARGRTPNPCIYCNSEIKFGYLLEKAKELDAGKIATGHFARIIDNSGESLLVEAVDKKYDQSYFLYNIKKDKLPFIDFPLGGLTKAEVRDIARENNLLSADRKSSQDICFASSDGDYRQYLSDAGCDAFTPGDVLDTKGKVIGKHKGIASYTVGQRKGLGLSRPEPVYVLKIDSSNNTITVGEKEYAMSKKIRVAGFNWLIEEKEEKPQEFLTRIRYNSSKVESTLTFKNRDEAVVEFKVPQFAPTPGQAAVFYIGDVVAGGAWIEEVLW